VSGPDQDLACRRTTCRLFVDAAHGPVLVAATDALPRRLRIALEQLDAAIDLRNILAAAARPPRR